MSRIINSRFIPDIPTLTYDPRLDKYYMEWYKGNGGKESIDFILAITSDSQLPVASGNLEYVIRREPILSKNGVMANVAMCRKKESDVGVQMWTLCSIDRQLSLLPDFVSRFSVEMKFKNRFGDYYSYFISMNQRAKINLENLNNPYCIEAVADESQTETPDDILTSIAFNCPVLDLDTMTEDITNTRNVINEFIAKGKMRLPSHSHLEITIAIHDFSRPHINIIEDRITDMVDSMKNGLYTAKMPVKSIVVCVGNIHPLDRLDPFIARINQSNASWPLANYIPPSSCAIL